MWRWLKHRHWIDKHSRASDCSSTRISTCHPSSLEINAKCYYRQSTIDRVAVNSSWALSIDRQCPAEASRDDRIEPTNVIPIERARSRSSRSWTVRCLYCSTYRGFVRLSCTCPVAPNASLIEENSADWIRTRPSLFRWSRERATSPSTCTRDIAVSELCPHGRSTSCQCRECRFDSEWEERTSSTPMTNTCRRSVHESIDSAGLVCIADRSNRDSVRDGPAETADCWQSDKGLVGCSRSFSAPTKERRYRTLRWLILRFEWDSSPEWPVTCASRDTSDRYYSFRFRCRGDSIPRRRSFPASFDVSRPFQPCSSAAVRDSPVSDWWSSRGSVRSRDTSARSKDRRLCTIPTAIVVDVRWNSECTSSDRLPTIADRRYRFHRREDSISNSNNRVRCSDCDRDSPYNSNKGHSLDACNH